MALTAEQIAAIEAQIVTLRAAMATGIKSVTYEGPPSRSVTYHSMAEMRTALKDLELLLVADVAPVPRYRLARTRSGFNRGGRGSFRRNE